MRVDARRFKLFTECLPAKTPPPCKYPAASIDEKAGGHAIHTIHCGDAGAGSLQRHHDAACFAKARDLAGFAVNADGSYSYLQPREMALQTVQLRQLLNAGGSAKSPKAQEDHPMFLEQSEKTLNRRSVGREWEVRSGAANLRKRGVEECVGEGNTAHGSR